MADVLLSADQLRARTLALEIRPGVRGDGFELLVFRHGDRSRYTASSVRTYDALLPAIIEAVTNFYESRDVDLSEELRTDPMVAAALCPRCNDHSDVSVGKKTQTPGK